MREFTDFAKRLADASAQVIKPYFRQPIGIDLKADQSPVTIADKKAEEVMRELIMKEFPQHGILGEEFGNHQPDAAYQWILDPIDGTKTFITGALLFGTLIALLKDGKPILGVINQPIVGDFLIGAAGQTHLNGQQVKVRPCNRIEDATLLATAHWDMHQTHNGTAFDELTQQAHLYRTWGDCSGYFLVAIGFADIMIDAVMKIWDVAPLVPIIEGAGGKITDWYGNNVLEGSGSVATAGTIHDEVIRFLNAKDQ